jgi:hypothetical protein
VVGVRTLSAGCPDYPAARPKRNRFHARGEMRSFQAAPWFCAREESARRLPSGK